MGNLRLYSNRFSLRQKKSESDDGTWSFSSSFSFHCQRASETTRGKELESKAVELLGADAEAVASTVLQSRGGDHNTNFADMEATEENEEGEGEVQVETNDADSMLASVDQAENSTGGGGAGGGAAANAAANMGVDLELADADAAAEFMKSQLADNSTFVENSGWLSENSAAMSENNGAELSADALEELMGGHQEASAYDVFNQNAIVGDSADAVYIGGF